MPDPCECPLCGEDNQCAMAVGKKSCWCFDTSISPNALAAVPSHAQGQACVCRRCATGRLPTAEALQRIDALTRNR